MHYDFDDILKLAKPVEGDVNGYKIAKITLNAGDTAYAPGTTKYWLLGHGKGGTVEYLISPWSTEGYTSGQIARSLKDVRG